MKKTNSFFLQKKRINRRFFLMTALSMLAGCHSIIPERLSIPFYGDKKNENKFTLLKTNGPAVKIQISPDSKFLAVSYQSRETLEKLNDFGNNNFSGNRLDLFNMEFQTPYLIKSFQGDSNAYPCHFAFDGPNHLLLLERRPLNNAALPTNERPSLVVRKLLLSELKEENSSLKEDQDWVNGFFSQKGDLLAVQDPDGRWKILDLLDSKKEIVFPNEIKLDENRDGTVPVHITKVLAFSPDSGLAAVQIKQLPKTLSETKNDALLDGEIITIWDLSVARQIPLKKAKKLPLEAILISHFSIRGFTDEKTTVFSSNGQMIAIRNRQNYVGIWQTGDGRLLSEFGEHRQTVTVLKFSPNNTKLAVGTGGEQGRLILWDIRKGNVLRTYDDPAPSGKIITALEFSPDGKILYFGNEQGSVKKWDYQNRQGLPQR